MQEVRAYYDEGKFVPLEPLKIPKGSQAIVTILGFPFNDDLQEDDECVRQIEAMRKFREEIRNCDEPVPEFDKAYYDEAYSDWRRRLKEAIALSMDEDLPDLPPRESMCPPINFGD